MEGLATFEKIWGIYEEGGVEAIIPFVAEDVVWEDYAGAPDARIWRGKEGIREVQRRWEVGFEDFRMERAGDPVAVGPATFALRVFVRGRGRMSGILVDLDLQMVSQSRDGRMAWTFFAETLDEARRRAAAGPPPG